MKLADAEKAKDSWVLDMKQSDLDTSYVIYGLSESHLFSFRKEWMMQMELRRLGRSSRCKDRAGGAWKLRFHGNFLSHGLHPDAVPKSCRERGCATSKETLCISRVF